MGLGDAAAGEDPVDRHLTGAGDRIRREPSLFVWSECGSLLVVAVHLGELRGARRRGEIRIVRRGVGRLFGPSGEVAEALVVGAVPGSLAGPPPAGDAAENAP